MGRHIDVVRLLKAAGPGSSLTELKKNVNEALKEVSRELGNTVTVCRKYYVHPEILNLYQQNELAQYLDNEVSGKESRSGPTGEERLLMKILKVIQREKPHPELTERALRASV